MPLSCSAGRQDRTDFYDVLIRRDEQEAAPAYAREKSVLSTLQPDESSACASCCVERKPERLFWFSCHRVKMTSSIMFAV